MSDEPEQQNPPGDAPPASDIRFPELEEMQREIAKRLADNRRFLERFLDDDFQDAEEEKEEDAGEDFEEL
jgi:Mn-dependent DtxR family transcriptional regulator